MKLQPAQLDIYRTAIPMRRFEHATAARDIAEAVVVRLRLADGRVGWGETLPRPYVTGETFETVAEDIEALLWPAIREVDFAAAPWPAIEALPDRAGGRCAQAARCAVELAAVDAASRGDEPLPGVGRRPIASRVSGVLGSSEPGRTARRLRLMRWYGLRDFKLKLGFGEDVDEANLRVVARQLGRAMRHGTCTLRVDVNGGWDAATTPDRVAALKPHGVAVVEQPVFCAAAELAELARRCVLPLMADESLVTADDARALLAEPRRLWWNIRISKNGGLTAARVLAALAAENGVPLTVGCMVGESSILSAAQRRLLESIPTPRFVEGNYGRLLLADDLARPSLRFGYGGRLKPLAGDGLGIAVDPAALARYGRAVRTLSA